MKKSLLFFGLPLACLFFLFGCSDGANPSAPNTALNSGTFTDSRDDRTYKWIQIGDQIWMAENLDFGSRVKGSENQTDATASSAEKYCYRDNKTNCDTYGGLYQWHSAMALPYSCNEANSGTAPCIVDSPHRGICPEGWHLPTKEEWEAFDTWVDRKNDGVVNNNAGESLKSTTEWKDDRNGPDIYGWTALPGGDNHIGSFYNLGSSGSWWSASDSDADYAWHRFLNLGWDPLYEAGDYGKSDYGFSVRCLRNSENASVSSSSSAVSSSSSAHSGSSEADSGSFTDTRDDRTYNWTKIGDQIWMAENLNFGSRIDGKYNQKDAAVTDAQKYCYDDDEAHCDTYGGLYQWHSAMVLPFSCNTSSGCMVNSPHRGICPEGWHLPTKEEWEVFDTWVDQESDGEVSTNAGASLKSTTGWSSRNGTDAYGWNALPGGKRRNGSFETQGSYGHWWSASGYVTDAAWLRYLSSEHDKLFEYVYGRSEYGFSVRCIKD